MAKIKKVKRKMEIDHAKGLNGAFTGREQEILKKIGFFGDISATYLREKVKSIDERCDCWYADHKDQLIILHGTWSIAVIEWGGMMNNYPTMVMNIGRPDVSKYSALTDETYKALCALLNDIATRFNIKITRQGA